MELFLNGEPIDSQYVDANDGLNFNQFKNEKLQIDNYQLVLEKKEFIDAIDEHYKEVRDEMKADDEFMNEESEFSRSGYGELSEVFAFKDELAEMIEHYLRQRLFERLFATSSRARYIINSIDNVEVSVNQIRLSGRTYSWPRA